MNTNVYVEINTDICIICLEKINKEDDIVNVCVKCNIEAHNSCLTTWYTQKQKKVCPICLNTEDYYLKSLIYDENDSNEVENEIEYEENSYLNNSDNEDEALIEYNRKHKNIIIMCIILIGCFIVFFIICVV